jgi:hypothetical protein
MTRKQISWLIGGIVGGLILLAVVLALVLSGGSPEDRLRRMVEQKGPAVKAAIQKAGGRLVAIEYKVREIPSWEPDGHKLAGDIDVRYESPPSRGGGTEWKQSYLKFGFGWDGQTWVQSGMPVTNPGAPMNDVIMAVVKDDWFRSELRKTGTWK